MNGNGYRLGRIAKCIEIKMEMKMEFKFTSVDVSRVPPRTYNVTKNHSKQREKWNTRVLLGAQVYVYYVLKRAHGKRKSKNVWHQ